MTDEPQRGLDAWHDGKPDFGSDGAMGMIAGGMNARSWREQAAMAQELLKLRSYKAYGRPSSPVEEADRALVDELLRYPLGPGAVGYYIGARESWLLENCREARACAQAQPKP